MPLTVSLQYLDEKLPAHASEGLAAGIHVGMFEDLRYKSEPKTAKPICTVQLVAEEHVDLSGIGLGTALASGTILARKLVNSPANVCTPTHLAKTAMALADAHPDVLSCKVLDKAQCEERGMGAFLGVAAASDEPLAFIHLTYTPRHRDAGAPVLALVGKGLTFDSGGYNIKAGAGSMIEMVRRVLSGCGPFFGWGGVRMPRATFVGGFKFSLRLPISPFFAVVR